MVVVVVLGRVLCGEGGAVRCPHPVCAFKTTPPGYHRGQLLHAGFSVFGILPVVVTASGITAGINFACIPTCFDYF